VNVQMLIEKLQTFGPYLDVLLASDEDGNSFHRVGLVNTEQFDDPSRYAPDLDEEGDTAVVIWP